MFAARTQKSPVPFILKTLAWAVVLVVASAFITPAVEKASLEASVETQARAKALVDAESAVAHSSLPPAVKASYLDRMHHYRGFLGYQCDTDPGEALRLAEEALRLASSQATEKDAK